MCMSVSDRVFIRVWRFALDGPGSIALSLSCDFAGVGAPANGIVHGVAVHATGLDVGGDVRSSRGSEGEEEDDARSQGIRGLVAHAQVKDTPHPSACGAYPNLLFRISPYHGSD